MADLTGDNKLHRALNEFQCKLDSEEKLRLQTLKAVPDESSVRAFTARLDEDNAQKRSRCVASRLGIFLESVQSFSEVVNTFVSSNPAVAGLIWGSVQLMLLLANRTLSYFDKITTFLMSIGKHCPRFSEYKLLFRDATRLQRSLCEFYAEIVNCCTHICDVLRKPNWLNLVRSAWAPFDQEFGASRAAIEDLARDVREEIRLASNQAAHRERVEQQQHRRDLRKRNFRELERRKDDERVKMLDKLSAYDYTIAFDQARLKCCGGTARWLTREPEFEQWITAKKSSTLVLSGKLGCGKTVLLSQAIADLSLRRFMGSVRKTYFFCRFDDESSLLATNILRSLIRQCLQAHSLSSKVEHCLSKALRSAIFEPTELSHLLELAIASCTEHYIVIDGIDECSEPERRILIETLGLTVRSSEAPVKLLISSRYGISEGLRRINGHLYNILVDEKKSKLDMATYIDTTLASRLEDGSFRVGDPSLVLYTRTALIAGAQGMFLWVYLQLEEVCRQSCDEEIREVIRDLPKDLTETYLRMLSRIIYSRKDRLAKKVFKWITAAMRPLSLPELHEALAIEPFATASQPNRYINDIVRVISWCEGFIVLEEINDEVHFAHPTIKSLLLTPHCGQDWFNLSLDKANSEASILSITYLNFTDFKIQLVKRPKNKDMRAEHVLRASLASSGLDQRLSNSLSKLFRIQESKTTGRDVLHKLSQGQSQQDPSLRTQANLHHPFLTYASKYWLAHSSGICEKDSIWSLWRRLVLEQDGIAKKPWSNEDWDLRNRAVSSYIVRHDHAALLTFISKSDTHFSRKELSWILHSAASKGSISVINTLLSELTPVTVSLSKSLVVGAQEGYIEVVDRLLAAKADVNAAAEGWTALQAAARGGHAKVVERLLEAKADVNAPIGWKGRTALQAAAEGGCFEIVERLLTANAQVNASAAEWGGRTALQAAAEGGYAAIVELLLAANADVNAPAKANSCTALQAAAGGGHAEVVWRLLEAKADVNAPAGELRGRTALQAAAESGYAEIVEWLLVAKADVNAPAALEWNGRTALQAAAGGGNAKMAERLLEAKADINAPAAEVDGRTALQAAAEGGYVEIVEQLLAAQADVNGVAAKEDGRTALQAAAEGGYVKVVERLLAANADVNAKPSDYRGRTALQAAARGGHIEVVERLLEARAEVNAPTVRSGSRTALQAAAEGGHIQVVERLLAAKAEINSPAADESGRTALQAAAGAGYVEVVEQLLAANADVDAPAGAGSGRTALQAAAEGGHAEIVERLLAAKANVNALASVRSGRTALQAAAEGGYTKVVEQLLAAKADVNANAVETEGCTALQAAAENGHIEIVERLLAAKANVNALEKKNGRTALQAAAGSGHAEIVELLLAAKANVNTPATEENGRTALQAAAGGGHVKVIRRLLEAKANVNAPAAEIYGQTALQAAAGGGHVEIVEQLLAAKADINAPPAKENGKTALQAAREGGHLEIVELLNSRASTPAS